MRPTTRDITTHTSIWADAVADALEYIRDAVKRRYHDSIAAGIQHLLTLASEVLGDNRGARQRTATQGCC